MIIWLPSFPRSGNTFFRIVSFQVFGIHTYSGFQSGNSDLERAGVGDITGHRTLPQDLEEGLRNDNESLWRPYHESDEVYVIKTHANRHNLNATDLPTILIVRDGRDAYISHAWYVMTVAHGWRMERPSLRSKLRVVAEKSVQRVGLGPQLHRVALNQMIKTGRWADFHDSWLDGDHPSMAVVRFQDLIDDPIRVCHRALSAVGAVADTAGAGELPDFNALHDMHPEFFRKGTSGDWREEMTQNQKDEFWRNHGEVMAGLGYSKS